MHATSPHGREAAWRITIHGNCRKTLRLIKRLSYTATDTPAEREIHLKRASTSLTGARITSVERTTRPLSFR